jgi:putative membrane protein
VVVNSVLLTVLGFVVGLALSFRSTTAYERYSDGRKSWATLSVQSRNLARYIWVHVDERTENSKEDLLGKVTAINMILAFAVSLKHRLRFEPYAHYPDIASLISHLDTFAKSAHKEEHLVEPPKTPWKAVGEYLGISWAASNPRKAIKRAEAPLGNLPLEILTYLSSYAEEVSSNGTLKSPIIYGQISKYCPVLYIPRYDEQNWSVLPSGLKNRIMATTNAFFAPLILTSLHPLPASPIIENRS